MPAQPNPRTKPSSPRRRYAKVDEELLLALGQVDPPLGGGPVLVAVAIALHSNAAGEAWPSQAALGRRAGLSERAVRRSTARLVEAGIVEVEKRGRGRLYRFRHRTLAAGIEGSNTGRSSPVSEAQHRTLRVATPDAQGRDTGRSSPVDLEQTKEQTREHPPPNPPATVGDNGTPERGAAEEGGGRPFYDFLIGKEISKRTAEVLARKHLLPLPIARALAAKVATADDPAGALVSRIEAGEGEQLADDRNGHRAASLARVRERDERIRAKTFTRLDADAEQRRKNRAEATA